MSDESTAEAIGAGLAFLLFVLAKHLLMAVLLLTGASLTVPLADFTWKAVVGIALISIAAKIWSIDTQ